MIRSKFILLCLLAWAIPGQPTEEEDLALRRIADFWQEGETQIAKSQIEEFLAEFPDSEYSDLLSAALGDLSLREKADQTALNYYAKIQSPEIKEKIFLNKMQCLYRMQWFPTLADECEAILSQENIEESKKLHATYFLAIALYHQCLNASADPEALVALAKRAEPHFDSLIQTELSAEVAESFAHLCCILKEFPKAAQIYRDLAEQDPTQEEEMLFQAALLEAEFDKDRSSKTFAEIASSGKSRSKDAIYNQMILNFERGLYSEILNEKETILSQIPPEKTKPAHLFFGRCYMSQKNYPAAIHELNIYLQEATPSETTRSALLTLIDATTGAQDELGLDVAIRLWQNLFPRDPQIAQGLLSRAQLYLSKGRTTDAIAQLQQIDAPEYKEQVQFELTRAAYTAKDWPLCQAQARQFLSDYPQSQWTLSAQRYLTAATATLGPKETLLSELTALLALEGLPEQERDEWQLLLAKTEYELGALDKATASLQPLLTSTQDGNAWGLLALIYRETDPSRFLDAATQFLEKKGDLIDPAQMHIAIFNFCEDAEHLYKAFSLGASIENDNLLWLADQYSNPKFADRAIEILERLRDPASSYKLAKMYGLVGRTADQIALLEKIPTPEAQLLLAESYAQIGKETDALALFDTLQNGSYRNPIAASAALHSASLRLSKITKDDPLFEKSISQLKTLVLQRNLLNEPLHLRAALEYIDAQTKDLATPERMQKKIALLKKTKADFESTADLLSKDYHLAREKYPEKDRIYQAYMHWIDAEILISESALEQNEQLLTNAKDILLQIVSESADESLHSRANIRLKQSVDGQF